MLFQSCGEDDPVKGSDQEYFPLQTGFYQVYDVVKKEYKNQALPDISMYELKTEVVDSFANLDGGFTFVIHRSVRSMETDPWQFREAWSARTNSYQAISTEGNISFVSIGFPAIRNKEWNGNALNTLVADSYQIGDIGKPYELPTGDSYNDAMVIIQQDEENELKRDQREEVYARGVGLIYKRSDVIDYCDDSSCFGQKIIRDGVEYLQVLKEHGQN